jgi:5-(carboxyamino)imidazole ribonucleotide synthase
MRVKPGSILGIMGGGQLGKMSAVAAANLGYKVHIYSDEKDSPASHVAYKTTVGSYKNKKALERFAKSVDLISFEFENIPIETARFLEKHVKVNPSPDCLFMCQNRLREKDFLQKIGVDVAAYRKVTSIKSLQEAYRKIGPLCILKTVELGYDGKGQQIIDENTNLSRVWRELKLKAAVLEKMVLFEKEISVILARGADGGSIAYIPSENIHTKGILDITLAPARISDELVEKSWEIANHIADELNLVGLLAVEFFVTKDGKLLVNELAPRPHNSGHWTLDGSITSQFEQFIRAICGLPLGSARHHSGTIMKNLIGDEIELWEDFITDPDSKLYLYGKKEIRAGRKMGHITHVLSEEDMIVGDEE